MRLSCKPAVLIAAFALVAVAAGCATPPPASDPAALADFRQTNDPLEPTNRVFYAIDDALDTVILHPIALAYHYSVPQTAREHVHNVLVNLGNPTTLANDVLEGKPHLAGDTTMRLLINTTLGVGGLFDVAAGWGFVQHNNDFGVTLGVWGLPGGPYLYLPVLGPSNPRDTVGFGGDVALNPVTWITGPVGTGLAYGEVGMGAIDMRERVLKELDQIKAQALDPYATLRSLYQQHRQAEIEALRGNTGATPAPPGQPGAAPSPSPGAASSPSPGAASSPSPAAAPAP
jgi:phospholipid-binding lipoprotein MlaA